MIFTPESSVLVIFCKRPRVGVGKQRVAAELGVSAALELGSLLLNAALEDAADWPGAVVIAPADPADADWAGTLLPGAHIVPQQGRNLGERINHVDTELRGAGAQKILYIGTDAPGLTPPALRAAAQALSAHDAVLMPALDGGVTLLGSRTAWPALDTLSWETARLGGQLNTLCEKHGLNVKSLPPGYDVDHYDDLRIAAPLLAQDHRPARQALAEWTRRQLRISIVVPVKHDTEVLRKLLQRLTPDLSDHDEIIVIDGENSKQCAGLCDYFGVRYLSRQGNRGVRMNSGVMEATNNIIWFLHADAEPDSAAIDTIRQHIARGRQSGYFRFRFTGPQSAGKRLLESAINLRTWFGIPYADQALFMTRESFTNAGGFTDASIFEEVALVKSLQRQCNFSRMNTTVGVSPRRWERDGWLKRTLQNRLLVIGHALGVPATTLARIYRGAVQSDSAAPTQSSTENNRA